MLFRTAGETEKLLVFFERRIESIQSCRYCQNGKFRHCHLGVLSIPFFCKLVDDFCFGLEMGRFDSYCFKTGKERLVWPSITFPSRNSRSTKSNTRCSCYDFSDTFVLLMLSFNIQSGSIGSSAGRE